MHLRTLLLPLLLLAAAADAQSGDGYDLTHHTIDGGGTTFSVGGAYRLGGTIGQPDAGTISAGPYMLNGGFWNHGVPGATPTPTSTLIITSTRTPAASLTPTRTRTATSGSAPTHTLTTTAAPPTTSTPTVGVAATVSATPTRSETRATPTLTSSATTTSTPSLAPSPSRTPTDTATPGACVGDCGADGRVTVSEIVNGVNIALDRAPLQTCAAFDANGDDRVTVNELIIAVNHALRGCATE